VKEDDDEWCSFCRPNLCTCSERHNECDSCGVSVPMGEGANLEVDHMSNPGFWGWYCDECAEKGGHNQDHLGAEQSELVAEMKREDERGMIPQRQPGDAEDFHPENYRICRDCGNLEPKLYMPPRSKGRCPGCALKDARRGGSQ